MVEHTVTYMTRRRDGSGYIYRTDADCTCGWRYSTHGQSPSVIRLIGEQHLRGSHESAGE